MWFWIIAAGIVAVVAVVELRSWRKTDRPVDIVGRLGRGRGITEGKAGNYDKT